MSRNGKVRAKVVARRLQRQTEKERAKVAKALHSLQQTKALAESPAGAELTQQLELLRQSHNQLVESHNALVKNYGNSLQHLDMRLGAVVLVIDDLVKGGAGNVTRAVDANSDSAEPGVYWEAYIKHYLAKLKAEIDAARKEQAAAEGSPLITPAEEGSTEETDVVFGGDQKHVEASSPGQASATG